MYKYLLLSLTIMASAPIYSADRSESECPICYDMMEDATNRRIELSCGHASCQECLTRILQLAVTEKNLALVKCPDPDCKSTTIERADIRKISNELKMKLDEIALSNLLDTSNLHGSESVRQCPSLDCASRFTYKAGGIEIVRCPGCNVEYCSNCLVKHPEDVTCEEHEAGQRATVDSRTLKTKMETTKPCPTCETAIEKIDGCLAVKCLNGNCLEFCFHCGRGHHLFVCNEEPTEKFVAYVQKLREQIEQAERQEGEAEQQRQREEAEQRQRQEEQEAQERREAEERRREQEAQQRREAEERRREQEAQQRREAEERRQEQEAQERREAEERQRQQREDDEELAFQLQLQARFFD